MTTLLSQRPSTSQSQDPSWKPPVRFIDLFAGIGGLRSAAESAGGQCVFTSEWDKFARLTYRANFPGTREIAGDIRAISASDIPSHDLLLAGFPCQPFSLAGVSKKNSLGRSHGFLDATQGTLFFDVARILREHRPSSFILENVKNLTSHDRGRTFEVIKNVLESELGYALHTKVLDARSYLPQHRQRVVLVGFAGGQAFDWNNVRPTAPAVQLSEVLHDEREPRRADLPYIDTASGRVLERYTLSDKLWAYLQSYALKHRAAGNGFGFGLIDPDVSTYTRTLSARYHKDGSEILIKQRNGMNPRRLTPRECARLMGFDDSFQIPVSDTQAYRQFGNSVAVPVFSRVAASVFDALGASARPSGASVRVA